MHVSFNSIEFFFFFFQAEDGIRDGVASRGLGDVYKSKVLTVRSPCKSDSVKERNSWSLAMDQDPSLRPFFHGRGGAVAARGACLARLL